MRRRKVCLAEGFNLVTSPTERFEIFIRFASDMLIVSVMYVEILIVGFLG